MSGSSGAPDSVPPKKRRSMFEGNGNVKTIALPLVLQLLVIIGGGIAVFYQITGTVRADMKDSDQKVIRQLDDVADDVEDVKEDIAEVKQEQKTIKKDILESATKDAERRNLKHRLDCHNKKSTKCDGP